MAAPSPVLYALHHSVEPQGFENLCVDLLVREGHSRIIPGGKTRDHGRDAEVRFWVGSKTGAPQTAFQFSKELKWERKLRNDIAKIMQRCDSINRIVFVSSRTITVEKQDKLREEFMGSYEVALEILEEGWFRVRLEEDHVDLALKHLGVEVSPTPGFYATQIKLHGLTEENKDELLKHRSLEELRATLTAQTKADPENTAAWKGLSHVYYFSHDYDGALRCATNALKYTSDKLEQWNLTMLKASIIAEQGIASGSRHRLNQAKKLFAPFIDRLGRSADFYNLANVLGALGELEAAENHYRRCLDIDPEDAKAWHNLGSLLVKLDRREEGISCIDQALHLKPDLLQALCTKANVLVMSLDGSAEALQLMERAFSLDPDLGQVWQHAHYWHAMALCQEERFIEAFEVVEESLERKFDCPYLMRLASDILSKLWRSDSSYIPKAEEFFCARLACEDRNYRALGEMLDILEVSSRESEAWALLDSFITVKELSVRSIAERIPLSISDLTESFASVEYYSRFREAATFVDYANFLADSGLRPHDDVPEILFHFLMAAYFKIALPLQSPEFQIEEKLAPDVILETYRLVSRVFSAFGGFMLAPTVPVDGDQQTELIARAVIIGHDIPLMEISRLLGFLYGVLGRDVPESYLNTVIETSAEIHTDWLTAFLTNVGIDWEIEGLRK